MVKLDKPRFYFMAFGNLEQKLVLFHLGFAVVP